MVYPILFLRIKAMMIDSLVLSLLLFSMIFLSMEFEITDPKLKTIFILIPLILLEPLMVWITGGSLGHHFSGIRIINKSTGKNLFVLNGIVRFITKTLLGVFSITTMFITKRHQSIHDFLSHSVVIFKNEAIAHSRHKLEPRETTFTSKKPSIWRRIIVILAYAILLFLVTSILMNYLVSSNCLGMNQCSNDDSKKLILVTLAFLIIVVILCIFGLLSKLPGAYYRAPRKD